MTATGYGINTTQIHHPPTPGEWSQIIHLDEVNSLKLWNAAEKTNQHLTLTSWNWQWRMGWVRNCTQIPYFESKKSISPLCSKILNQAVIDPAILVRKDAVQRIAVSFAGTKNQQILSALDGSLNTCKNTERWKSLKKSILSAMHKVGLSDQAMQKKVQSDPELLKFVRATF